MESRATVGTRGDTAVGAQPVNSAGEVEAASSVEGHSAENAGGRERRPRKGGLNQELRMRVKAKYQPRTVNLMVRYNKLGSQLADFSNNVAFLSRCANMSMIPKSHRVYNGHVRNTRAVVRLLDQCSFRVMIADLEHNRSRKYQVMKNRERVEGRLKDIMSPEDFEEVRKICDENREEHFTDVKARHLKEYQDLLDEYKSHETRKQRRRQNSQRTESVSSAEAGDRRGPEDGDRPGRAAGRPNKQDRAGRNASGAEGGSGKPRRDAVPPKADDSRAATRKEAESASTSGDRPSSGGGPAAKTKAGPADQAKDADPTQAKESTQAKEKDAAVAPKPTKAGK